MPIPLPHRAFNIWSNKMKLEELHGMINQQKERKSTAPKVRSQPLQQVHQPLQPEQPSKEPCYVLNV